MDDCSPAKIGLGAAGVIVVAIVIIIATSFGALEPTEIGISYNNLTKNIDKDNIYTGGRHWIWFTNSFVVFPGNQRTIEFSDEFHANQGPLVTRTKEGLSLTLHISFQYQLNKDGVADLYEINGLQYEKTFIRIARDIILQEAGNHPATEYWASRTAIGMNMEKLLDDALKLAHCSCKGIQLMKIVLPQIFEDSIVDTQVEVQRTRMKQLEQKAILIRQETNVMLSKAEEQIMVINAKGTSQAIYIKELAKAQGYTKRLGTESYVFHQAQEQLGLKGKNLAQYQYLQSLLSQDKKMLVGVDSAMIQVKS